MQTFTPPSSYVPKLPLYPLVLVIVLTLASFSALWATNAQNTRLLTETLTKVSEDYKIFALRNTLLKQDKLSNAAIQMYVLSNDDLWQKKYLEYEAIIDKTFNLLNEAITLEASRAALAQIKEANEQQTAVEKRAQHFMQAKQQNAAKDEIFSENYTAKTLAYEEGLDLLSQSLHKDSLDHLNIKVKQTQYIKLLIGLSALIWLYLFYMGYQRLRKWRQIIEQTTDSLSLSEKKYRDLMEHASCGIFINNSQGVVLNVNTQGVNLLGLDKQQIIGQSFADFVTQKDKKNIQHTINSFLTEGLDNQSIHLNEICIQAADQTLRTVYPSLVMIKTGNERLLQIITTDVTEVQKFKSQAIVNDRLANMGILAAGIAHEVNNPLAWIIGNLDLMQSNIKRLVQNPSDAHHIQNFTEIIAKTLEGAQRVSEIVHNFKDFSRSDDSAPVPVDVNSILDKALEMISLELKYHARLEKRFATDLPLVMGNKGKLHQVFLNILMNALQSMASGTVAENTLQISTSALDNEICVKIQDSGSGIAPEVLPHIFDLFYTTKPIGEGTGCGLFICHDIIYKMGGNIKVLSTPGAGSSFFIYLPTYQEPIL